MKKGQFIGDSPFDHREGLLKALGEGPEAHSHHGIFDVARLLLTFHQEELHEQWLRDAVDDTLRVSRERASRKYRNHLRAKARALARQRQRSADPLATLSSSSTQPEPSGSAVSVASGEARVEAIWDAVKSVR